MVRATFRGVVDKLEIARGHDGLFRGGPDPVLVVGVYAAFGLTMRLIGRTLHRFPSKTKFPTEVAPDAPALPAAIVESEVPAFHFVLLAIALEEDGGTDVQRMFGTLEHVDLISLWSTDRSEVEPVPLAAFPDDPAHAVPRPVELVIDSAAAAGTCTSDKWIGAVCWSVQARAAPSAAMYRLPFLAPDRRNDWTAIVTLEH